MGTFDQLVKERRSANNFLEEYSISKKELNEIFDLVKFGPSAFNLQHTNYITVIDPEMKSKMENAAYGQHKVKTSSAVIIVLGDKKAYQNASKIYEGLMLLGMLSKPEYDQMVENTVSFYETRGEEFERDEAIRNASLSAMLFMMTAKDKGWDTCPMIGFDPELVRDTLNIGDQYEVVMMMTIGKEKVESRKPRGYRKPVGEFVKYI